MKGLLISLVSLMVLSLSAGTAYGLSTPVVDRDVVYCNCHGTPLIMDIYYPKAATAPKPVIVYIHGGGWYSGDKTTGAGQDDISELVARGYLVAAINYRLAPRYKFPAQIEDAQCAIRFLRANAATYGIDPAHFGVFGDSAGGHLAALLGVTDESYWLEDACDCVNDSSQVQAVVDMFGPTDLTLTFEKNWSLLIEHVFGVSDPESEVIKRASPVTYASSSAPPFLIIHGDRDEQVLPEQSDVFYKKLVSANVPVRLVMVKNAGHGFSPVGSPMSPTRAEITHLVGDFFDQYLK